MVDVAPDWREIYAARRNVLRKALGELDCLLVASAANRFYLSGFELEDSQPGETAGFLLICQDGQDWLLTDGRYLDAARRLWAHDRILVYAGNMAGEIAVLLKRRGSLIGIESAAVSAKFLAQLRQYCHDWPALVPESGLVETMRAIKEPVEIAALEASFALNQKMFDWLDGQIATRALTNKSESAIAWDVEKYFRENGAQSLAFSTIVATSANGALPHAIPGAMTIEDNSPLLVDAGCRVENYCSDQTRSWWYGSNPSRAFLDALALTKEAQQAALAIMKPGIPCAEVYDVARKVFEKGGVADRFTHGLGHGVGLETHEAPTLSPRSKQVLKQGMVVTVEPGLYYPEWGGVRWEHTVLVEEHGVRILGASSGERG